MPTDEILVASKRIMTVAVQVLLQERLLAAKELW
jgi:hypothetical protein